MIRLLNFYLFIYLFIYLLFLFIVLISSFFYFFYFFFKIKDIRKKMLKIIGLDNFKVSLLINRISEEKKKRKLPNSN